MKILKKVKEITDRYGIRTYAIELAFVATALATVWVSTGCKLVELVGSVGVLATFAHAQVSQRMEEKEGEKKVADVHCWRWTRRYFYLKELAWLIYFLSHGAWSALVGVFVFLLYYPWRKAWRTYASPLPPSKK